MPTPAVYRAALREVQADPRQRLLVLDVGGRVVGTTSLVIVPNLSNRGRPYAIIENVVVDATERGAGLGERLVAEAVAQARRAGCYKLSLTSNLRRAGAHRFYERLGFRASHAGYRIDL